ncbi:MAG TPA: metalloregulator ArsR/SmtB family transcription factor [Frateuria sp.]|uniref:ArsR/SmtB family transcription factor n=1 Tax=Frateuria sp. TaxID=2211372 RepID=UPI002D80218F|nr:metalloregulator ArsR/SmtB family transcription factor [Frateuria sp.]HET6805514.1 metalloregulator ArsR/SmtB family transcription factor [Frateuria sp.]
MPTRLPADLSAMHARADEAARLLKALGNPQRLRMLCLLVEGERSVGQLHEALPALSQSALSQHLARLREDGLVSTRREAQSIHYALEPGPAQAVIEALHDAYCAPSPRPRGGRR